MGLGAVILLKESNGEVKTIAYAPRTLLPVEKGDCQIEKEAIGIIFVVKSSIDYSNGPPTVTVYIWF